ncbi:MAG: hypothetical protein ACR2L2_18570 [Acidobacteriota bacterium]
MMLRLDQLVRRGTFLLFCMVFVLGTAAAWAETLKVVIVSEKPPAEVPVDIAAALSPATVSVVRDDAPLAQFWLRETVPVRADESVELGVAYTRLEEGTLLGVVRLAETWADFKGKPVRPGVYALRYGLQLQDGNHMGASEYRDFLLLIPIAEARLLDAKLTTLDLIPLSRKASGTPHPSVLALVPCDNAAGSLVRNDHDQWIYRQTLKTARGPLPIAIVVWGKAAHE